MRFLHAMLRVRDLDASLHFYCELLGLKETRRRDSKNGRYTLVYLATGADDDPSEVELTYNWDQDESYGNARNFGHLAFSVPNIYSLCDALMEAGVPILRPPRDGHMAFIKSPDGVSIELLQEGSPITTREPWISMPNTGSW